MKKRKKLKLEIHNFFRYPCMYLLEHILQPSQFLPLTTYPFSFAWKWELFMALLVTCGFISETTDLWGCGHRIHSGGVGIPGPCSEGLVQGCDAGDLQEPAVCGWGWLPSRAAIGYLHFPCVPLGRTWCLSSERSGDLGMTQLHKVKLTCFRCCVCLMSRLRLSQSLIMYKAHWQMKRKHQETWFPIFYLLTFGSVFKNIHSTLDFFLLITLNIFLFVLLVCLIFLAAPFCMWDFSSLSKDQTCIPCIRSAAS